MPGKKYSLYVLLLLPCIMLPGIAFAKEWAFTAYLDGKEMGQHIFTLNENGDSRELVSQARFNVKVLFINAYQYQHTAKEQWQGDCLNSLNAHTEENKTITDVKGQLENGAFTMDGQKGKQILPACVMTFAYWNPKMLTQTKLINPQNGEWLDVKISKLGNETIQVKGQDVMAEHYSLEAKKMRIELWYGAAESAEASNNHKDWLALKSTTPEGHVVSYKLR